MKPVGTHTQQDFPPAFTHNTSPPPSARYSRSITHSRHGDIFHRSRTQPSELRNSAILRRMRRRETYPTAPDLTDGIIPTAPSKDRAGDRQRRNSLNSGGFRAQPYPTNRDVRGGVRSNPDGSQIRTSTVAGNSGFIARTFTNTNMANFFEHNKNLIPMAMVFYFRNMAISHRDVAEMLT
ncbi:hypothetical protein H2199_006639 [Coniosporium tulheliwenetii]|uniref:Uncharacterized protein n=1 Tax=Coniosporium tulheliwenetii TaxID=3383036 RepID=A0ACC2YU62_9PEZI|nr:hypothetical protein H2199_006639 [Cladosporium sp. JES 115]